MNAAARNPDIARYFEYSNAGIEVVEDGLKPVPFGEFLVERRVLTREQLFRALTIQDRNPGVRLGEVIAALGYVPFQQVDDLLAEYQDLPAVEIA